MYVFYHKKRDKVTFTWFVSKHEYVDVDDISDVTLVASDDRTSEAHKICVYNYICILCIEQLT